jgi:hypothetical protein
MTTPARWEGAGQAALIKNSLPLPPHSASLLTPSHIPIDPRRGYVIFFMNVEREVS